MKHTLVIPLVIAMIFCHGAFLDAQTFSKRYDTFDWLVQNEGHNIEISSSGFFVTCGTVKPDTMDLDIQLLHLDEEGVLLSQEVFGSSEYWEYNGSPNSLTRTIDGGFVMGGSTKWPLVMKFDNDGTLLWQRSFETDSIYPAYSALQFPDSSFYAVGWTTEVTQGPPGNTGAFLYKMDSEGDSLWIKRYTSSNYLIFGYTIIATHDKGLLLGCRAQMHEDDQDNDFLLIKTDSLGNEQWRKKWGGAIHSSGAAYVNMVSDSNYVMCSALEDGMGSTNQSMRAYAAKIDTTGDIVWEHQYGPYSYPILLTKIEECTDGTFIAAGMKQEQFNYHGLLLKLSPEGDSLWYRTYTYADEELDIDCILRDVIQTTDGGYIACGYTDAITEEESRDVWVLKVDEWGCLVPGCQVGILEQEQTVNFLTYPNPANDVLNIYLESLHHPDGVFNLVDINGKCVKKFQACSNFHTYIADVSDFPAGIYILTYTGESGESLSQKVVIE